MLAERDGDETSGIWEETEVRMVEALDDRREVLRDGMELDALNEAIEQLCSRICDEGERTAQQWAGAVVASLRSAAQPRR